MTVAIAVLQVVLPLRLPAVTLVLQAVLLHVNHVVLLRVHLFVLHHVLQVVPRLVTLVLQAVRLHVIPVALHQRVAVVSQRKRACSTGSWTSNVARTSGSWG